MRIYELAKELDVPSKDLIEKLHSLGIEAKNHMTALEDSATALLRSEIAKAKKAGTLKPAAAPKPVVAPKPEAPRAEPPKAVHAKKEEKPKAADPVAAPEAAAPAKTPKETPAPVPAKPASKAKPKAETPAEPAGEKKIVVLGPIVVKEFAERLGIRPNQLISELMGMNILASLNERVDVAAAKKIAEKHGFEFEHQKKLSEHTYVHKKRDTEVEEEEIDKPEDMVPRPPVVTFLGHVDHGKTSLLDKIRDAAVAKGEHGGITQHIGAYTVETNGHPITFLDTPGHEAFTAMRARGANMTDIAVIIIAVDDGIMPQTREAIQHAKAADVSIMVAINKIDLRTANVDKVKQQLQGVGLAPEEWGGNVICCPVSAVTGEGISHLLDMILLQAEVLELKTNPKRRAKGYVIEARLEPGMGPVTNLLVTSGTLHVGDTIVCGQHWGRIRALINDHGIKLKSAASSMPVKCLGLSGVPRGIR